MQVADKEMGVEPVYHFVLVALPKGPLPTRSILRFQWRYD